MFFQEKEEKDGLAALLAAIILLTSERSGICICNN